MHFRHKIHKKQQKAKRTGTVRSGQNSPCPYDFYISTLSLKIIRSSSSRRQSRRRRHRGDPVFSEDP